MAKLRAEFSALPLFVASYLSGNRAKPISSLRYLQVLKKVDTTWFYGMANSRPYRLLLDKIASKSLDIGTHSVSITVINHQINPIVFSSSE